MKTIKYFNLNDNAFDAIKAALEEHSKMFKKYGFVTKEAILAYMQDAQNNLSANGGASFEIGSLESTTGCPVVITLDDNCIDIEEIEDDE